MLTQVAPPTAASIVANGVKANGVGKAATPEPEPVADEEETPAPAEDASEVEAEVEAKEDGEEEVRAMRRGRL